MTPELLAMIFAELERRTDEYLTLRDALYVTKRAVAYNEAQTALVLNELRELGVVTP